MLPSRLPKLPVNQSIDTDLSTAKGYQALYGPTEMILALFILMDSMPLERRREAYHTRTREFEASAEAMFPDRLRCNQQDVISYE